VKQETGTVTQVNRESLSFTEDSLKFLSLLTNLDLMKSFKKSFKIKAEPSDVYASLTNPYTIELWSGYPAQMSSEPGSEFSLWEGDITGRNLEFIQDKKLVQEWYFGDQIERSIVTITISADRENSLVTVEQTNIPDEDFSSISEGWRENYFEAISSFFNPNF
jgi:activator of HSP90 ATPase